jgi:GDP-4-dehydro-6-deoxy-D-mannose reductase
VTGTQTGRRRGSDTVDGGEPLLDLDLAEPTQVRDVFERSSPDVVLHLAGAASVADSWRDPGSAFRSNASGTAALLRAIELIAPEAHLVLASSAAVYGKPSGSAGTVAPFTEEEPVRPASPYGASKAAAEILAFESQARTGLAVTAARLFNQVGPGQSGLDAPVQFADRVARAEADGEPVARIEVGNPGAARDYTDVRDTARALRLTAEHRVIGRLNVCSGTVTTMAGLVELLAGLTKVPLEIESAPHRAHENDVQVVSGSPARLQAATGWEPGLTLEQSLAALLDYRRASAGD